MFKGLTPSQIASLKKQYGENSLPSKEKVSWWQILLEQFKNPLIYVLFFVGLVSVAFGEHNDVLLILGVVLLNVAMGFYQEFNAKKTLQALHGLLKPKTTVVRNGIRQEIQASELVPGDIVVLGSGDKVPADGRLLESISLLINESILTGESEAVEKCDSDKNKCQAFMGTTVLSGRGILEVQKIGVNTEIGQIGKSLSEIQDQDTPLQIKLDKFAHSLMYIILFVSLAIFLIGIAYGQQVPDMFRLAIILAVAAIPEGLPVAITLILAIGMRKILKQKGLVKRLLSIETLGVASVICTDKTGTLTEGNMKVVQTEFSDRKKAILAMVLANDQKTNLEIALWEYVKKNDVLSPQEINESAKRILEESFDSQKKYMATINMINGREMAFIKGAPEVVLKMCHFDNQETVQKEMEKFQEWASNGLRVLGLAFKETKSLDSKKGYTWLGLVGIQDPIRKSAHASIQEATRMGIKVKIVTGDYLLTAMHIADQIGIDISDGKVLEGHEIEKMNDTQLRIKAQEVNLFARITPIHKLRIVKALQEMGEVVAMTGDGVNDAPALKQADIGVVVGDGTEVAKEAGDLILLDNNFETIVSACQEGRLIFSNIKKVVGYTLSNSFAEMILILGAMLLRLPAPLTIVQILWIHFICDGPMDLLLGFEPKTLSAVDRKPKEIQKEEIMDWSMKTLIFGISFITGALALAMFYYYFKNGNINLAQTIAFATLAVADLIYVFSFKDLRKPIFQTEKFFANVGLFWGVLSGFVLVYIAIYNQRISEILGTVKLNPAQWGIVLIIGLANIILVELVKFIKTKIERV